MPIGFGESMKLGFKFLNPLSSDVAKTQYLRTDECEAIIKKDGQYQKVKLEGLKISEVLERKMRTVAVAGAALTLLGVAIAAISNGIVAFYFSVVVISPGVALGVMGLDGLTVSKNMHKIFQRLNRYLEYSNDTIRIDKSLYKLDVAKDTFFFGEKFTADVR